MSKFSLNGFKKISKTADTTTLQHPAGHELTIKHTLLSPKLRGDIEALPHISEKHPDTVAPKAPTVPKFAEGSKEPVQAEENGPDAADRRITEQNAAEESKSKSETESKADADKAAYEAYQSRQPATEDTRPGRSNIDDLIESHKNLTDSHNAIVQAVAGNQQSNPQSQTVQPVTPQDQSAAGTGQMVQPITPEDKAAAGLPDQSQQPAAAPTATTAQPTTPASDGTQPTPSPAGTGLGELQDAADHAKAYITTAEAKNQKLLEDAQAGKIDPKQYFNNLGTVGKISTVIGLLMGGIGAAGTGGKNLAVGALNEAIQRDVDAQISNKSNAMNLYKMNLEATHNGEEARNMTVNQQLALVQAALAKQAAGTTNAQALQNLQKGNEEIKKLKFENDNAAFQSKMRDQVLNGNGTNVPLSTKIQYGLPKEQQAEGEKQASEYDSLKRTADNVNQIFDNMEKEQTTSNLANPQSYLRQKQNKAALVQAIMETSPSKRLTKESIEQEIKPFEFGTASTQQTRDAARKGVLDIVKAHSGPMNLLADRGLIPPLEHITAPSPTRYSNGVPYKLGSDGHYHRVK